MTDLTFLVPLSIYILSLLIYTVVTVHAFRGYFKAEQRDRRAVIGLVLMPLIIVASVAYFFFLMGQQHVIFICVASTLLAILVVPTYHLTAHNGLARKGHLRLIILLTGVSVVLLVCWLILAWYELYWAPLP